ncbi:SDR family oxidoreductase [Roseibium sp. SCP14]|uniref:SDR family oxidoreductase n=1 Tax=Roseibium sp. SCP14 TaxID=3141375 RepID=UPI00333B311B
MTVLVFGGSGTIGRSLVPILHESGMQVRVATRSKEFAATLPAGVEAVIADMDDPASLRRAFEGVESVFLLVANDPLETQRGLVTLAIAVEASCKHIVYLSNYMSTLSPLVPHSGPKIAIEAAIRYTGIPHTILRPTNFAQNDLWLKDAIIAGAYPWPIGNFPMSRIDARDVALAAANVLANPRANNEAFTLASLESPNGEETAALWSRALGRTVVYPGYTPEEFEASMETMIPSWFNFDFLIMNRYFERYGCPVDAQDFEAQAALLPDGPRSYTSFVEETAAVWRSLF